MRYNNVFCYFINSQPRQYTAGYSIGLSVRNRWHHIDSNRCTCYQVNERLQLCLDLPRGFLRHFSKETPFFTCCVNFLWMDQEVSETSSQENMFCSIAATVLNFISQYLPPIGFLNNYRSAPTNRYRRLDLKPSQRFRAEPNLAPPRTVRPNQTAERYEKVGFLDPL